MALAKNYIKNFGIPRLDEQQKRQLLILRGNERQVFIKSLYGIDI